MFEHSNFNFAIIGTILIVVGTKRKEKAQSTKEQAAPDKENSEDEK